MKRIALLRAVNVGKAMVPMAGLREMLADLDLAGGQTLLQSGNLVFEGGDASNDALERRLEAAVKARFDLATDIYVRDAVEWREAIDGDPFAEAAKSDPGHLLIYAFKAPVSDEAVDALRAAIVGPEHVAARGRHLYAVYPDGVGRSKLTVALIARKLGQAGTGRNWNTVLKLAALLEA